MKPKSITLTSAFIGLLAAGFFIINQNSSQTSLSSTPKATTTIIMKEEIYEPQNIEIKKGTKVIFKNEAKEPRWPASNIHPTHGIYPEFDPKQPVQADSEWSFVFDKEGKWKYHDHLVPLIRGEIIVN